jgi:hypothetical protein
MESNELDRGRSMMKSMEIEDHGEAKLLMVEEVHKGDKDSLHEHKHHMNPQIPS